MNTFDKTVTQERSQSLQENQMMPSFSMVFETENLASVELENIFRSLSSLATQDISPTQANEFLIIDSGNAPPEVIAELCAQYPWITVKEAPGISYYEAKMLGANLATGEIVVYCDSDCVYVSNWLSSILSTFMTDSDINVVAGETSTPVRNVYEIAIAMHYFFPRFSNQEIPYISSYYFLNNVAFRRHFLIQYPIPTDLPLYRGNCSTHSYSLCQLQGYPIWTNPKARAIHEPPTSAFAFWRYLLLGHDYIMQGFIRSRLGTSTDTPPSEDLDFSVSQTVRGILYVLRNFRPFDSAKIRAVLQEDKTRLFTLPIVIPIILYFELLMVIGRIMTYLHPNFLLRLYAKLEQREDVSNLSPDM
jgi:glycosyltransferase involved in cell wall biosynthesis